jgi:dTDP-4-amino-4,6-dideoxygalactose transaminase
MATDIAPLATAFLPFALPDIGEAEINAVVDVMRSGWITTGASARQFEAEFASFIGSGVSAIAVNSATAGLHLALEALEAAITPRTKVVIPVHFAGLGCDMRAICDIARKHRIAVVEDAAHSLPTVVDGQLIGAWDTDACVFSFYATKTITTGEGGMVVSRNAALLERCRVMRLHGISRDSFDRYTSTTPAWYYEVIAPGFKYNMTDVAAAVGIQQLRRLRAMSERRREIAERYTEAFADLPVMLPPDAPPGDQHAWHLYVLRLTDASPYRRNEFVDAMAAAGIGCSVHFIPLHIQPYWRDTYGHTAESFPHAYRAYSGAVSLPIYTKMTDEDQERVIRTVRDLLGSSG